MWRFILVSFGFLGFAFYQLSGGASYKPAPGSLQVAMRETSLFAAPRVVVASDADTDPQVVRAEPRIKPDPLRKKKRFDHGAPKDTDTGGTAPAQVYQGLSEGGAPDGTELTLAPARETFRDAPAVRPRPVDALGTFSAETLVRDVSRVPIEDAIITSRQGADIRSVVGSSANMRSGPGTEFGPLEQLARGTQVEVLDRRGAWVELRNVQTGQTGWMADWLITAHN